jgi:hypothetical protein
MSSEEHDQKPVTLAVQTVEFRSEEPDPVNVAITGELPEEITPGRVAQVLRLRGYADDASALSFRAGATVEIANAHDASFVSRETYNKLSAEARGLGQLASALLELIRALPGDEREVVDAAFFVAARAREAKLDGGAAHSFHLLRDGSDRIREEMMALLDRLRNAREERDSIERGYCETSRGLDSLREGLNTAREMVELGRIAATADTEEEGECDG